MKALFILLMALTTGTFSHADEPIAINELQLGKSFKDIKALLKSDKINGFNCIKSKVAEEYSLVFEFFNHCSFMRADTNLPGIVNLTFFGKGGNSFLALVLGQFNREEFFKVKKVLIGKYGKPHYRSIEKYNLAIYSWLPDTENQYMVTLKGPFQNSSNLGFIDLEINFFKMHKWMEMEKLKE